MRTILLSCLLFSATPLMASQPISESFVECAQLVDISNRRYPERLASEKGAALRLAAERLIFGGIREAEREGRSDPEAYVSRLIPMKAAKWDEKGIAYLMTDDFMDWMRYCSKLAGSRGITLRD